MTSRLQSLRQSMPVTIANVTSIFCMAVGGLVLCGWLLDIPLLKSISPEWISMKANTAACFILAGASLWILREENIPKPGRFLAMSFAAVITLVGMLTLAEYTFQKDLGIDQLLFEEVMPWGESSPGRMAPAAAVCFVLIGLALLGLDWKNQLGRLTQKLPLIVAFVSLFSVIGYLYEAKPLYYAFAYITPMASHTSVSFIALSLGLLCVRFERSPISPLMGAGVGSHMARWLLPTAFVIPVLLGWLWLAGEQAGIYGTEVGTSLLTASLVTILVLFVWQMTGSLNREEAARSAVRKQADEKVRSAAQYARSLIEASLDPLVTISPEGKITDVNEGSIKVTGVPRETLIDTDFCDYFTEPERAREGYQQVFAKGSVTDYPLTIRHEDGHLTDVLYNASVYKDIQGNVLGVFAAARDVTERNQAEAALLKAGALQNAIFNSANFSSIATDAKGVIQIFNVGAERMLGYTAAEVVDKITPADISDPQELIARAEELSRELETTITPGFDALVFKARRGIEDIYELTYIRKDGSRFPAVVSVTALRDKRETVIGYLLIGTDNTARKLVEADQKLLDQRLRDQQFYTRSLIESNIDALITTDPLGIITDLNKPMEALTGCTRAELIGAPFKNYFTDPERAEAGIKLVLSEKKLTDYELTVCARDGKHTVVSYNATTFYNRGRKLQGVFAAARDVTERKRLDQILLEKNVELENAKAVSDKTNLAKSDFLANMSHELRTPLNSVIGFSEVLQDQLFGPINEKQQEYVSHILTSGKHLLSLINDILDLSKVESGKMELELSHFPLRESLDASLIMFREKALKERVSLHLQLDPLVDINISADQRKLKQILFNLLSNAIKFTPAHGTVIVDVARDGNFIEINVQDTGVGIRAEDIPKLFQTFTQLESAYTKRHEGTGLGLALTRKLVELHGGRIWVKSEIAKGSCFTFNLPINEAAIKVSYASRSNTVINNNSCVLLIEDEPITLTALKYALQSKGYRVLRAKSGEEGLEMAQHAAPDLIVLDLVMPGMSGFEVANQLQDNGITEKIPVLILTAMDLSSADRSQLAGKVWRIEEKGSLATSEFIHLVEKAVASNKAAEAGRSSP